MSEDALARAAAEKLPTPFGRLHLHFFMWAGKPTWVVRTRKSSLCRTPRCRRVDISLLWEPTGEARSHGCPHSG